MNQLLLGAAIPFCAAAVVYAVRGGRAGLGLLIGTPVTMAACAIWAVVPDLPRFVGLHALYLRLSMDPRMNMFFWHYSIDRTETDSPWYAAGFALLAAALLLAAWRELCAREDGAPW